MAQLPTHTDVLEGHIFLRPIYKGADLQDGVIMPIKFMPEVPGEYGFAFPIGFCPGKLVVEQEV